MSEQLVTLIINYSFTCVFDIFCIFLGLALGNKHRVLMNDTVAKILKTKDKKNEEFSLVINIYVEIQM